MYSEKASTVSVFICNPKPDPHPHTPVYLQKKHSSVFIIYAWHLFCVMGKNTDQTKERIICQQEYVTCISQHPLPNLRWVLDDTNL
jgi:hypothetical protein